MNPLFKLLFTALGAGLILQSAGISDAVAKSEDLNPQNTFAKEPGLRQGYYAYIIRLRAPAVASLSRQFNRRSGYTRPEAKAGFSGYGRLDANIPEVQQYAHTLRQQQRDFLARIQGTSGTQTPLADFQYALNAVVLTLTPKQAAAIARLPQVAYVERSKRLHLNSDSGPAWTGADLVWSGQNTGVPYQGEGVVVGVMDTGINSDHPSFSEISGDDYQHQNPLGGYLGDCVSEPTLCNNKLIGVYSYDYITGDYEQYAPGTPQVGEDHNGHGSHVAAIAAGNVLYDQPLLDAAGEPMPDFTFDRVAGIAPRANIISYQVCFPGEEDAIGFSGCPTFLVVEAVEQAIIDGVDVLNHSIGAEFDSPWQGSKGQAFLNAREAGVIITNSAGNSGPDPESASSDAAAPWVLTVGAYSHDRVFSSKTLSSLSGGETPPPATIEGEGKTAGFTGVIVYAGDYTNANDPDGDPAQCLEPFPAGTFAGEIVLCNRGDIARVDKGKHVKAGGAGALVLANIEGDATNLVADNHVLPAIHIDASDGNALRNWLASGNNHQASISASDIGSDPGQANIGADFTSRGPNNQLLNVITPSLVAPGIEIWSAYADDQPEGFKEVSDAADFAFLNGTSMAAPSVAGAAALLRGLHPQWSAAQIQSALLLSAIPVTFKEDGQTPSDPFDMGSGMLNVSAAANTGLIMDIGIDEYQAADPDAGGDPRALNMPSLANSACFGSCTWLRTLEATRADTWSAEILSESSQLVFSVSPSSFSLNSGERQQLEISADSRGAEQGQWLFAALQLTSTSGQTLTMPIAIKPKLTTLPESVTIDARRNADSVLLADIQSLAIDELTVRSYGLTVAQSQQGEIAEDSSNSDVFDDLNDGVATFHFTIPANAKRFIVEVTQSQAPDLDLWVGRDTNNDGVAQETELLSLSASASAIEKVEFTLPEPGDYWVLVQNWQGSGSSSDSFTLSHAIVDGNQDSSLDLSGPDAVDLQQPFALRVGWDQEMTVGDKAYGGADLGTTADLPGNLGLFNVDLLRLTDDVTLRALSDGRVAAGEEVDFEVRVSANPGGENRRYVIHAMIPDNAQLLTDSISGDFSLTDSGIRWQLNKTAGSGNTSILAFSVQVSEDHPGGPLAVSLTSELPENPGTREAAHQPQTSIQVEGPPLVLINNQSSASVSGISGGAITLMASASDPNEDELIISWKQTSGTAVSFDQGVLQPSITLPQVTTTTVLGFQVTVTDPAGLSSQASVSVSVNPRPVQNNSRSGGGSLSMSLLAMLLLTISRGSGNSKKARQAR